MDRRTEHRGVRSLPIGVVLTIVAVGLVLVATDHWRRGGATMASAAAVGSILRLVVPERFLGPLAVRSRPFDVVFFAVLAMLLALAAIGF